MNQDRKAELDPENGKLLVDKLNAMRRSNMSIKGYIVVSTNHEYDDEYYNEAGEISDTRVYLDKTKAEERCREIEFDTVKEIFSGNVPYAYFELRDISIEDYRDELGKFGFNTDVEYLEELETPRGATDEVYEFLLKILKKESVSFTSVKEVEIQ